MKFNIEYVFAAHPSHLSSSSWIHDFHKHEFTILRLTTRLVTFPSFFLILEYIQVRAVLPPLMGLQRLIISARAICVSLLTPKHGIHVSNLTWLTSASYMCDLKSMPPISNSNHPTYTDDVPLDQRRWMPEATASLRCLQALAKPSHCYL